MVVSYPRCSLYFRALPELYMYYFIDRLCEPPTKPQHTMYNFFLIAAPSSLLTVRQVVEQMCSFLQPRHVRRSVLLFLLSVSCTLSHHVFCRTSHLGSEQEFAEQGRRLIHHGTSCVAMGARTLPKMGTLFFTTLALCSSLLVSPSSAYAPTPALARTISSSDKSANSKTGRYSNGSNVGHFSAALDAPSGGGGGSGVGSPAQLHTGSRGRLLEAVGELRGGSPATKFPGYDTAAAAIAAISIPAATLTAGPALFVQVCLGSPTIPGHVSRHVQRADVY